MAISFADHEIYSEAVRLGLVVDGEPLTPPARNQAVSQLFSKSRGGAPSKGPRIARVITVRPGRGPLVDGKPFPWVITDDSIAVEVRADGSGFVRLTIPAELVRIDSDTDSPEESEPRA